MSRGGKFLVATAVLAVAACSMDQGKLEIRSTPTALAQGARPVPQRVAEGRAKLALGNVGLAIEAFRIALREDPNSIDALAGLAACYDRMGRFDLSRRNYEAALAVAPADVGLLTAFAQSLQLQGKYAEAQRVQVEIAQRRAVNTTPEIPQLATRPVAPVPVPEVAIRTRDVPRLDTAVPMALTASTTVTATEQAPAPAEVAIPRPPLSSGQVEVASAATLARADVSAPNLPTARMVQETPPAAPAIATQNVEQAALGPSVTIKLPPARRAETPVLTAATAPTQAAPAALAANAELPPLTPYRRPVPQPTVVEEQGPRLERLSMGEIGLVTTPGPMWRTTTVARTERSTTVRWISLQEASMRPTRVRLLNAARVERLAARTRSWLVAHGWGNMAIGDAPATRSRSVILYPSAERTLARTLANQFGFAMEERSDTKFVTMLLGRDAARIDELRPRRA